MRKSVSVFLFLLFESEAGWHQTAFSSYQKESPAAEQLHHGASCGFEDGKGVSFATDKSLNAKKRDNWHLHIWKRRAGWIMLVNWWRKMKWIKVTPLAGQLFMHASIHDGSIDLDINPMQLLPFFLWEGSCNSDDQTWDDCGALGCEISQSWTDTSYNIWCITACTCQVRTVELSWPTWKW